MSPIEAAARALFDDMKRNGGTYEVSWEDSPKELQDTLLRMARVVRDAVAENVDGNMRAAFVHERRELGDHVQCIAAAIRAAGEE